MIIGMIKDYSKKQIQNMEDTTFIRLKSVEKEKDPDIRTSKWIFSA